jgi:hypothetical protein
LSALQRAVKLAKLTTLISAVWTVVCAALLGWISSGAAETYRVSSVARLLKGTANSYVLSSLPNKTSADTHRLGDWLLDLPATVPLLIVAALLVVLYLGLAMIERREFENYGS